MCRFGELHFQFCHNSTYFRNSSNYCVTKCGMKLQFHHINRHHAFVPPTAETICAIFPWASIIQVCLVILCRRSTYLTFGILTQLLSFLGRLCFFSGRKLSKGARAFEIIPGSVDNLSDHCTMPVHTSVGRLLLKACLFICYLKTYNFDNVSLSQPSINHYTLDTSDNSWYFGK